MNRKGFTLIELLMVIILIGILTLILMPNIITLNSKNNIKSCKSLENNVISATKMYVAYNKYDLGFECNGTNKTKGITLSELVTYGYLDGDLTNPVTKKQIDKVVNEEGAESDAVVEVTYNCDTKQFTYTFDLKCEEK